jgi:hypothetical protein
MSTPKNSWQIQSVNAYESHQKYFLQNEDALARTDLKRAIKYAKQSSDLTTLATISLSECALHVSVLEEDRCENYLSLKPLVNDEKLYSYYLFLQKSYDAKDIKNLPTKYQAFASLILQNKYDDAQKELLASEDLLSKMIMASLMKDSLHVSSISTIIDEASFYGYKKNVLSWMEFYTTKTTDEKEKNKIQEKLRILKDSK